ncbi:MAG: cyanophycin synthetase, partial [Saprospiraceae bacterium]|nr:cyanophycin synthetase [Saprospiraceae bacterium]
RAERMTFSLLHDGDPQFPESGLGMPGRYNVLNATAAWACLAELDKRDEGLQPDVRRALEALRGFRGIKRRYEIRYAGEDLVVIDDYAHHPQEIEAVIAATREQFPGRKITGVFQPHLYSRTRDFHQAFATVLSQLDVCILVELYPAREQPIPGVSSEMIFALVQAREKYCVGKTALIEQIVNTDPEILLVMGAGDLDRMIPNILEALT